MRHIRLSHEICAPAGAVFALADNLEGTALRHKVGSRSKMEAELAGLKLPIEVETTEVVPDRKISGVLLSGLEGRLEWRFEPGEGSTWVSLVADYELPPGTMRQIRNRWVADRDLCTGLEKTLIALERMLEARSLTT